MVGYYPEPIEANPQARKMSLKPCQASSTSKNHLVCSPDLTIFGPSANTSSCISDATLSPSNSPANLPDDSKSIFQCLLCQKAFDHKSLYQSHLRSHGKDGGDPYRCNICGKTFAVPARLTRHYRTHTGEKPYQCEYCSKSFSVKENLSVHRRIHTKERPYKCDVCERAFEHSGKLHRHMRIHTGERPHKCTVCAKTFIQSGQLVIHMRTHTGEKPYVCKACGKGFTCSKQLKVHTRTHTGEKPYSCDICGKSFGYNHVLKLHQVAHYGEKVYKCTLCHETFGSKKTMELHIKTHSSSSSSSTSSDSSSISISPRDSPPMEPEIEISSVTGASSDKENKTTDEDVKHGVEMIFEPSDRDYPYYVYPTEPDEKKFQPPLIPVEPQHVFLYPETSSQPYGSYVHAGEFSDCSALLDLPGNDARRRVEAALEAVEEERQRECAGIGRAEKEMLTPPSSNPVSPVPSPDPLDLAVPVRETLILPPRKRCKMILESMESERNGLIASQRQNTVIQFAKAS